MPRRRPDPRSNGRGERERPSGSSRRRTSEQVEQEALRLRERGATFASIARRLELPRSTAAHAAFLRALQKQPEEERTQMIDRERQRLDDLEGRIRQRDADQPEKLERRLVGLDNHRKALDDLS